MKKFLFICLVLCALLCIGTFAAENVVYISDGGTGDGTSATAPVATLGDAYAALGTDGGTIVVVGKVTITEHFTEPTHAGLVTVTQVYDGNDYRTGNDYGINIAQCRYIMNGDTTFKNMAFRGNSAKQYNHVLIVAQFNYLVMDEGVECIGYGDYSVVAHGASILGGVQSGADKYNTIATDRDSHINIKSGEFIICGFSRQVSKDFEGMAHIDISGGVIHNIYPGNGQNGTAGDVDLNITGGTFVGKIITGTVSVVKGTLDIKITGGDFTNFKSADGTVASGGMSIFDVSEHPDGEAIAAKAENFSKIITEAGSVSSLVANDIFQYGTFTASNGIKLPYRYYIPAGYEESANDYPLFLYMHGNGSRGSDNTTQLTTNGAALNNEVLNSEYDCIMLAPQCAKSPKQWVTNYPGSAEFASEILTGDFESGEYLNAAIELLDYFVNTYRVDPTRIYVTGSSNGGGSTWSLTGRHPYVFAAAVPLAGCKTYDGVEAVASRYVHQNIWTFHGDADTTLPVEATRAMVTAIKNAGSTTIKYTEIAGGGHNIWSNAAKTNGIVDWIFSKTNSAFDNTLRGDREMLATPSGLAWNENVATFGAVNGARAYRLTVCLDGEAVKVYEITETSKEIDVASLGMGEVTFTVTALASDLSTSMNSNKSAASAAYAADEATYFDYDKNGTVDFEDAFKMLKDCLNKGTNNILTVIRVLKYIVG